MRTGNLVYRFGLFKAFTCMVDYLCPDRSNPDRAVSALKYSYSQLIFQFPDLTAQSGLANVAALCGFTEMAGFRYSYQVLKIT
jgi:hypothetical protein